MSTSLRVAVRSYEIDSLGHVTHTAYHQWGELGRFELFRAAGCSFETLHGNGISPVMLESRIRFLRELRAGAEVDITTAVEFGAGKAFRMHQQIVLPDGTVSADIDSVLGVIDLTTRRLQPDPRGLLTGFATRPELLESAAA